MPGSDFGDYDTREQVEYTCSFIDRVASKMVEMGPTSRKVKAYLRSYSSMMLVSLEDLGDETYGEYVARITT
jgi:hypothetical protein